MTGPGDTKARCANSMVTNSTATNSPGAMVPLVRIRPALASEAGLLGDIAYQSKAHWGYRAADLARWRDELIVAPGSIESCPTWVARIDDRPVGFAMLEKGSAQWALEHLWVLPDAMHRGAGRALLLQAVRVAGEHGALALSIDADPNAERFYLASGAHRVGAIAAPVDGRPDRVRPQLLLSIPRRT